MRAMCASVPSSDMIVHAWDEISAAYQTRYSVPVTDIEYGPMAGGERRHGLLGSLRGKSVLDVGCGGGQNAIACALAGAARVVAIDPSGEQITFARRLAAEHDVRLELHQLGAQALATIHGPFDVVLSCYALMFVEAIGPVFAEFFRLLEPGGVFITSVDHPFRLAGEWQEDEHFVIRNYFEEGWQSWRYEFPESARAVTMFRYHRTIESWVRTVCSAGLTLTHVLEPFPPEAPDSYGRFSKHGVDNPRNVFARQKLCRVPGTLILRGVRP